MEVQNAGHRHGRDGEKHNKAQEERWIISKRYTGLLTASTPNAIYKWQNGESLPTLDNLVILAEMLGVSIDEVIVTKRF